MRELLALPPTAGRPRCSPATTATRSAPCARCAGRAALALVGFDDFELADLLATPAHRRAPRQPADGRPRRRARLRAARRRRPPAAPRHRPDRARRPRIRGDPAAVKPQLLPPNVLRHFYAGGARIAALRGLAARLRPHARGVARRRQHDVRRTSAGSAGSRTARSSATPSRRRPGGLPRRRARRAASAPTPPCWSSCSTPASACPSTSTPAARSPRGASAAATARPRRGSSSRPSAAPPCTSPSRERRARQVRELDAHAGLAATARRDARAGGPPRATSSSCRPARRTRSARAS